MIWGRKRESAAANLVGLSEIKTGNDAHGGTAKAPVGQNGETSSARAAGQMSAAAMRNTAASEFVSASACDIAVIFSLSMAHKHLRPASYVIQKVSVAKRVELKAPRWVR